MSVRAITRFQRDERKPDLSSLLPFYLLLSFSFAVCEYTRGDIGVSMNREEEEGKIMQLFHRGFSKRLHFVRARCSFY